MEGKARIDLDRLTHAYILSGSGARDEAQRMAAAMLCAAPSRRPCGQCRHCRKVLAGIHPDVIFVAPEENRVGISVGQARELRQDAYVIPNEAERKVYVIDPADKLNPQAQNALLKVLEEPPKTASFLLVTPNPALLLDTVRSRCVEVNCSDDREEEPPTEQAQELYQQLRKGRPMEICEALLGLEGKREKNTREQLAQLSRSMQSLALEQLHRCAGTDAGGEELAARILTVFRRFDDGMAVNVSVGNLVALLLKEFLPLE